jgi:hypothetical protein
VSASQIIPIHLSEFHILIASLRHHPEFRIPVASSRLTSISRVSVQHITPVHQPDFHIPVAPSRRRG